MINTYFIVLSGSQTHASEEYMALYLSLILNDDAISPTSIHYLQIQLVFLNTIFLLEFNACNIKVMRCVTDISPSDSSNYWMHVAASYFVQSVRYKTPRHEKLHLSPGDCMHRLLVLLRTWDISIVEFVRQFEIYCRYRQKSEQNEVLWTLKIGV